jgi:hypothetical protein
MPKQTKMCQIAWLVIPVKSNLPGKNFSGNRLAYTVTPQIYIIEPKNAGFKNSNESMNPLTVIKCKRGTILENAMATNRPIRNGLYRLVSKNRKKGKMTPILPIRQLKIM